MSKEVNHLIHSIRASLFRNFHGKIPVKVNARKGVKISVARWAKGEGFGSAFEMDMEGRFYVDSPGTYTVYVKSIDGSEDVSNVTVRQSLPFLLAPMFASLILVGSMVAISIATGGKPAKQLIAAVSKPVVVSSSISLPSTKKASNEKLMVTDNITSAATFSSGKSGTVGSWSIENAKGNNVIMQAQLLMDGKVIATSLALKPGQKAQTIQLSRDVSSGTHSALAYINYYNIKTQNFISRAGYHVGISVG